jgi:uncharacterized protein YdeI (YjbR/CyaY-like superfamily)
MTQKQIATGVAHDVPADLRKALRADTSALEKWEGLTPLARNEWICWVVTVKLADTRKDHVKRTVTELLEGKRRPCCWLGCIHRTDKPMSPSVKWVLEKQRRSK